MENLINQISVEITGDRTVQLSISKTDLDFAYVQMKLSEETSRECVIAITGEKFSGIYRLKKFYGHYEMPATFQINSTKHSDRVHHLG